MWHYLSAEVILARVIICLLINVYNMWELRATYFLNLHVGQGKPLFHVCTSIMYTKMWLIKLSYVMWVWCEFLYYLCFSIAVIFFLKILIVWCDDSWFHTILKICFQIYRRDQIFVHKLNMVQLGVTTTQHVQSGFAYIYIYMNHLLIICLKCDTHGQEINRSNKCRAASRAVRI